MINRAIVCVTACHSAQTGTHHLKSVKINIAIARVHEGECIVVVKTSLSGFDVTMWLQHLVLVPQMCSDRP